MFKKLINIIKEHKELIYLVYHDSLTGLLNRNWLYKNINSISHKYVYFIDINDLHTINKDGHVIGDEYIKKIVNSIKLINDDILVRYAGDEFILFSNRLFAISTNDVLSVGWGEIKGDVFDSIHRADIKMIKSKNKFKNKKV